MVIKGSTLTQSLLLPAVEQTDIHSPQTTVHEALIYSAYLRLPGKVGPAEPDLQSVATFATLFVAAHRLGMHPQGMN